MKLITISAAIALLGTGCAFNCITANGPVETRTVEVAPFTRITVDGSTRVIVEKADVQTIAVTGQSQVIDLLETKVGGGTWKIRTSKCWNSDTTLTVHIGTPAPLSSIAVSGSADVDAGNVFGNGGIELATSGSGSIRVTELNAKSLEIGISGSGDITVRGTSSELEGSISGSGNLHAVDLAANAAQLEISGSGSATVKAISTLDVSVSGSGEVRYSGKPDLRTSISGSGSVMPIQ